MRATDLLRSIDNLPYGERLRRVITEARGLSASDLQNLLGELTTGTPYERSLGLTIAEATRDVATVTRLLNDPIPAVHSRALAAVGNGVPVSDDDLRILYDDAPAALRIGLLKVVRKTGRARLAARLIDEHRERWGDPAAAALLVATDDATVERLLPELAYCLGSGDWRRLGAKHPKPVHDYALRTLPTGPDRNEWWQGPAFGLTGVLEHDPERATLLLVRALPPEQLPTAITSVFGRLIDADPLVLELLLEPERAHAIRQVLTPAVRRRLNRYADDDLIALGELLWPDPTALLEDLPPSRRATIFNGITKSVDLGQAVLPARLLTVLPHELRVEQARRMLTLAPIADHERERRRITAFLPYDEAFALLAPDVHHPDADDRALVYRSVIAAAGRSRQPAAIESALEWATKVRNDRDGVRGAVMQAVNELPPSTLSNQLTGSLQILSTAVLESRDASWSTRNWLIEIALSALRQGAACNQIALLEWGLETHGRVTENNGTIMLYGVIDGLPRGQEIAVYDVLRPYVDNAVARLQFRLPFAIARAFDKRGWTIDHLQDALAQGVWSNQENTVDEACELWLWRRDTRSERVAEIINRDVGMAQWPHVWGVVTELRTDLLDAVLAEPESIHRFDGDYPDWEVPLRALRSWLPRQQARYGELIAQAAADERMPEWARAQAVSTLGRIPSIGRAALEPFLQHDNVLLQEAALSALAWTDSPQEVLPVLLAHANDDRARVASYAVSRAARFVRPSLLPGLLHPILVGDGAKVTSRKEAARLLGSLRAPGASAVLADAWAGAHRDVRAAITSAASLYLLHEPASWALLQEAVHDSDATAVVLTQRPAYGLATKYRSRYAELVVAVTNRPEPEVVRTALQALPRWAPWSPSVAPVCAGFIADLNSKAWSAAMSTLVSIVATDPGLGLDDLQAAVRLLVRAENDPNLPNATPDRDHPARQRLAELGKRLIAALQSKPAESRQTLKVIAAELDSPELLDLRLDLLVRSIAWDDLAAELPTLIEAVADRPIVAYNTAFRLGARLGQSHAWTPEQLEPIVRELLRSDNLMAGFLAWTIIGAGGRRTGWAPVWRELLVALRNHPQADVRQAALETVTATES
ncbi:HEAT repeat domain-containing protein [Kribbella sp. NPDC056951]|uniref:HEAT repeat domain-containing protein n=1 Tax=Kribbella sp. NPDC056951 TaxID=3345978 RepID=UPI0036445356